MNSRTISVTIQASDGAATTLHITVPADLAEERLGDVLQQTLVTARTQFGAVDAAYASARAATPSGN